jgi:leucyl-tRNA synthetase
MKELSVKIAIQINGKTKEIIEIEKDLNEDQAVKISKKNDKIKKFLVNKNITRTIFVKNKIINYLIN